MEKLFLIVVTVLALFAAYGARGAEKAPSPVDQTRLSAWSW